MTCIHFDKRALDRLWYFVDATPDEIGGFGIGERGIIMDENVIVVKDIYLVQQYASKSAVDFIEGGGVNEAINRMAEEGLLGSPEFVWVSWHSHNSMKAFWSSTDDQCIKDYGQQGIKTLVSIVGNHSHEYRMRLDYFGVEHDGFVVPQITRDSLQMFRSEDPAWAEQDDWSVEIKEAIKERPKLPPATGYWNQGGSSKKTASKKTGATNNKHEHEGECLIVTVDGVEIRRAPTIIRTIKGRRAAYFSGFDWLWLDSFERITGKDHPGNLNDRDVIKLGEAVAQHLHERSLTSPQEAAKEYAHLGDEELEALDKWIEHINPDTGTKTEDILMNAIDVHWGQIPSAEDLLSTETVSAKDHA
jgi:hypothetical protein